MIEHRRLLVFALIFTMALGLSLTLSVGVLPFYGLALAALASAAVPYMLHTHPGYVFWPVRLILPAALALAAPSVAHGLGSGPLRVVGVFGPAALLYAVIYAEYQLVGLDSPVRAQAARLLLTLSAYAVALAHYLLIWEVKERSLISAPLIALISGALALRVLTLDRPPDAKIYFYAGAAALAMAEVLWPLNYWVLGLTAGGLLLLLAFYVLIGLMRELLAGTFSQAILLEYGAVSAAGALVVFGASRL